MDCRVSAFVSSCSIALLAASASGGGLSFTDVTDACGLGGFVQTEVRALIPVGPPMISGGCVGDFNGDGWQDIYVVAGGHTPDKLFINNGDGTFTDQAASWGVDALHTGGGASAGDYNNDGHLDIFVASYGPVVGGVSLPGPGHHKLYRNNGDNTFTNVATAAGVNVTSPATPDGFGSTFGDYDLDGDLDLLVLGWIFNSGGNKLFRNNGDGTFTDVTFAVLDAAAILQRGFSPAIVDMNGDGHPDILMACDFGNSKYFANNGDNTFTNMIPGNGTGLDGNGMGQCVADFNGDGMLDWYVTSIFRDTGPYPTVPGTGNMLYMNIGNHRYREMSNQLSVKDGGWGWGTRAIDIDHDADMDIVETNGWPFPAQIEGGTEEWINERCYLYMNPGNGGAFTDVAEICGLDHAGQGRGLCRIDYDNDGDADILIFSNAEPLRLYRNDLSGPGANWLRVFLDNEGLASIPPAGLGSMVRATVGHSTTLHPMLADCSYLATSEQSVHIGLGTATAVDELLVTWPNGRRTLLTNVTPNQTLTIGPTCDGDADGDNDVDFNDLLYILFRFGAITADADVDGSGLADFNDLIFTLFRFGDCD